MHCEFSGGIGKFTWFHASVVVTVDSDGLWHWAWEVRLQSSLTELPARPRRSSLNQPGGPAPPGRPSARCYGAATRWLGRLINLPSPLCKRRSRRL